VRAVEILRSAIEENLVGVHQRRLDSLWRAVAGLVRGGQLYLTGLGRALPGATSEKHRIKAVDRFLGNKRLHLEIHKFYRAIAAWLLARVQTPVIAVDWTGAGPHHCELSAKLCSDGRALPLLSLVFAARDFAYAGANQQLLRELAAILPKGCKPILVTDAGFGLDWFDAVAAYGWDYVGRVRGTIQLVVHGNQCNMKQLHRLAGSHAKDLGTVSLGMTRTRSRRLILSSQPRLKGRKRRSRRGKPRRARTDRMASKGAREPWVLATSLPSTASAVVKIYALRMQIEQSFRDRKSQRTGWSMRLANTRSIERMAVLMLIASLAELAAQLVGRAVAKTHASRGFQANTIRSRRVHSFVFLGARAVRTGIDTAHQALRRAASALLATIFRNAQLCSQI
jgi:Transposase DDE domain